MSTNKFKITEKQIEKLKKKLKEKDGKNAHTAKK